MFAAGALIDPYALVPIVQSPNGFPLNDTGGYDLTGRGAPVPALSGLRRNVLLSFGQSYITNSATGGYVVTQAQNHNLCLHNGAIYPSKANMLGCSDVGDGVECNLSRLGDMIIAGGALERVIQVPIAIGGTHIAQWAPGGLLNHRIGAALRRVRDASLAVDKIMLSIGAGDAAMGTTTPAFQAGVVATRATFVANGCNAPMYLEKCNFIGGVVLAGAPAIYAAIDNLVDGVTYFAGPNSDTLDATYRHDGAHWNAAGSAASAGLWKTALGL